MKVVEITYKCKDSYSGTLFNHTLFGRVVYSIRKQKKIAYYNPGILTDIKFLKISNNKVLISEEIMDNWNNHLDILSIFGEILISDEVFDYTDIGFKTGEEYWKNLSLKKSYDVFKVKKRNNRKSSE